MFDVQRQGGVIDGAERRLTFSCCNPQVRCDKNIDIDLKQAVRGSCLSSLQSSFLKLKISATSCKAALLSRKEVSWLSRTLRTFPTWCAR